MEEQRKADQDLQVGGWSGWVGGVLQRETSPLIICGVRKRLALSKAPASACVARESCLVCTIEVRCASGTPLPSSYKPPGWALLDTGPRRPRCGGISRCMSSQLPFAHNTLLSYTRPIACLKRITCIAAVVSIQLFVVLS